MLELVLVYVLPTLLFCWLADGDKRMRLPGKMFTSALLPLVCCVEIAMVEALTSPPCAYVVERPVQAGAGGIRQ